MMAQRINKRGDKTDYKHVRLARAMILSDAYQSLSPNAVKLWIDFLFRYDGWNNGHVPYAIREACILLKGDRKETPSKATASKAIDELLEKGFIKVAKNSSFSMKRTRSRRFTLTCWPEKPGMAPTNDWAAWKPKNLEYGSLRGLSCPSQKDVEL